MANDPQDDKERLAAEFALGSMEQRRRLLEIVRKKRPDWWLLLLIGVLYATIIAASVKLDQGATVVVPALLLVLVQIMVLTYSDLLHKRIDALIALLQDEKLLKVDRPKQ